MKIRSVAAAAVAVSVVSAFGEGGRALRVYTWADYISPGVIQKFERRFNCSVAVETFDSNESMYEKFKSAPGRYDIVMPSSYQIEQMAKDGVIDELDHSRLPNVKRNFDSRFAEQIIDPTFTYNVPYAVTYTGLCHSRDGVPGGVSSWAVLGDVRLKGRISMLDDMREVIGAGLMYMGCSVNSRRQEEIDGAVEQILKWKANIRKFDADDYKTDVASGAIALGQGYSTDVLQMIAGNAAKGLKPRPDIVFALPKEGFSIAFDEMVIPSASGRKELAYAFINFIYDPEVARENMEYIKGPCPVAPAINALDADFRKLIVLDEPTLRRGQLLLGLGDQKVVDMYNRAWSRIKAGR